MSNPVLQRIAAEVADQAAVRQAHYTALVALVAGGGEPGSDDVLEILGATGRTLDQLAADVARRQSRAALVERLAELPAVEREVSAAAFTLETLRREKEEVVAKLNRQLGEASRRLNDAHADRRIVEQARDELRRTASPELLERVARIGADIGEAESRASLLRHRIEAAEQEVAAEETPPNRRDAMFINGPGPAPRRGDSELVARVRAEALGAWGREVEAARARGVPADELTEAANAAVVRRREQLLTEYRTEAASRLAKLRAELADAEALVAGLRCERRAAEAELLKV